MESIFAIIKQINEADISPSDKVQRLREQIPKYVRIVEESHVTGAGSRIILSLKKNEAVPAISSAYEYNGVVLDAATFKLLVVPPRAFFSGYKMRQIKDKWAKYTVYAINDGTIINLYHYNGAWRMSTAHGFDVSNLKWFSDATYGEAFESLFKQYEFSYDKLDVKRCYTIGFRHPGFHPLATDSAKMWFVQSVNIDEYVNRSDHGSGPTIDTQCDFLPEQTIVKLNNMNALVEASNSALDEYFIGLRRDDKQIAHNYGYILRGPAEELGAAASVIIESTLMRKIRQLVYNVPKSKHINTALITNHNERLQFMVLQAYMSASSRYVMYNLFPQFIENYKHFENCFKVVRDRVVAAVRNKAIRARVIAGKDTTEEIGKYDVIVKKYIPIIENRVVVDPIDHDFEDIVMDFIFDEANFNMYFTHFVKTAKK